MPVVVRKFFVAALLTLCLGVQLLEMSGRWDRTMNDANDEAGVVAIVLCVGAAVAAVGTLLSRIRFSPLAFRNKAMAAKPAE